MLYFNGHEFNGTLRREHQYHMTVDYTCTYSAWVKDRDPFVRLRELEISDNCLSVEMQAVSGADVSMNIAHKAQEVKAFGMFLSAFQLEEERTYLWQPKPDSPRTAGSPSTYKLQRVT